MAGSFLHGKTRYHFAGAAHIALKIFGKYNRGHLLFLLSVALAAIGVKIIATLWLYFSWSPEAQRIAPQPAQTVSRAADADTRRWQAVYEQNWFGQYQPTAAGNKAPAEETSLHLVLRGIAYGANPAAVIEEEGQQHMYCEGDVLDSYPATVGKIFPDHLLLYYQGEIERLSLADSETRHHRPADEADAGHL